MKYDLIQIIIVNIIEEREFFEQLFRKLEEMRQKLSDRYKCIMEMSIKKEYFNDEVKLWEQTNFKNLQSIQKVLAFSF